MIKGPCGKIPILNHVIAKMKIVVSIFVQINAFKIYAVKSERCAHIVG